MRSAVLVGGCRSVLAFGKTNMKAFPWLLLLAFEAISLTCWPAAALTDSVYRDEFKDSGFPTWTQTVLAAKNWFPVFPLPWLVYSIILTSRRDVVASSLFTYAGTICLGCCLFLCWIITGLLMPYYATHIFVSVRTVIGQ
ncbi:MAG: hypothetical protein JNL10_07405 [Verrucomicrobiales bacterium]|nr:hypothetical protein [Verrucomicrobiales bacterium]